MKKSLDLTEVFSALRAASRKPDSFLLQFLSDLLTPRELEELGMRWQIFTLLEQGVPQREIAKRLGVGIATVTRGARVLSNPKNTIRWLLSTG